MSLTSHNAVSALKAERKRFPRVARAHPENSCSRVCVFGGCSLSRSPSLPERYEAVSAIFNTDAPGDDVTGSRNRPYKCVCVSSTLNQTVLGSSITHRQMFPI